MNHASTAILCCLLPAVFSGCGAGPESPQTPRASGTTGVERYFPLGDGYVYTYETTEADQSQDMLLLRVKRLDKEHAQLQTASGVRHLIISPNAIRREGSGFVLRGPLDQGASWEGDNGGRTHIEAVNVRVSVPAGNFADCIRTVERIGQATGKITSVFCDGVGIAEMRVEQWEGATHAVKHFALKAYGPPVDLDAPR